MKKTSYLNKPTAELQKTLKEKRVVLRDFRFAIAGSKTRNVKEGKQARKEIARVMTELNRQK